MTKNNKSKDPISKASRERNEFPGQDAFAPTHAPAVKLEIGESFIGNVIKVETYNVRDFKTKQEKSWDDGSPVLGMTVELADDKTGEIKTLWVQGVMVSAYRAALAGAGISGLASGDKLTIKLTEEKKEGRKVIPVYAISIAV